MRSALQEPKTLLEDVTCFLHVCLSFVDALQSYVRSELDILFECKRGKKENLTIEAKVSAIDLMS